MKRAAIQYSGIGLILIAFSSTANAVSVNEITAKEAQGCSLIDTLEVSDSSQEKALVKLKKEALEVRADSILILDSSESRFRKPTLAGGIKTVNKVSLEAELYDCLQQDRQQHLQQDKSKSAHNAKARKAEKKSIKERLEILQNLRDDELITEKEYSQKKSEILQEL
jgi:hypothetical protein